jgi:predicted DNA-binding protein
MAAPMSVRLGEETRRRVARIARRKGASPATILRKVIEEWAEQEESVYRPYDAIADLIGVVRGGDPTRSTWSSAKIARLLKNRRKRT